MPIKRVVLIPSLETGNAILEVLPPAIVETEPLNCIPTQSMGTREGEKIKILEFPFVKPEFAEEVIR